MKERCATTQKMFLLLFSFFYLLFMMVESEENETKTLIFLGSVFLGKQSCEIYKREEKKKTNLIAKGEKEIHVAVYRLKIIIVSVNNHRATDICVCFMTILSINRLFPILTI